MSWGGKIDLVFKALEENSALNPFPPLLCAILYFFFDEIQLSTCILPHRGDIEMIKTVYLP